MASARDKPRRAVGTGSLYLRQDRHGRESWYGQYWAGRRRVKRAIGLKRAAGAPQGLTQRQAEAELRRLMDEERHSPPRPLEELTLSRSAPRTFATSTRSGASARRCRTTSRRCLHLAPFFGSTPVHEVEPEDVEAFMAAERRARRAPKSFLDEGELEALLPAVPEDERGRMERVLYLTAAMTGLRQGELIALRWRDVDWTAGRIRVRRNFVRGEYGTPKSKRSSRSVPMADRVAAELERHFQRSSYQADDDLVFGHPLLGAPLDRSRVLKRFKAAAREAGVRNVRFHDLRHTFGTRLAAAGVPLRTIQEWMGHREYRTTERYADYAPAAGRRRLSTVLSAAATRESGAEPGWWSSDASKAGSCPFRVDLFVADRRGVAPQEREPAGSGARWLSAGFGRGRPQSGRVS